MAKVSLVKGTTSYLARIFIQDSSKTDGSGLTGLTSSSSGLICYRARDDDGNAGGTAISLSAGTLGTWSSGGFVEKDATNMKGVYELGIPNAALVTGSKSILIMLSGATNMAPCPIEIELTGWDNQDAVRGGMSALPNAAAGAANGLWILGANAAAATTLTGVAASGGTPATPALALTGGAASTSSGGTAAPAAMYIGGAGAASTNGAAQGAMFKGGGTTTVSGADAVAMTGTGAFSGLNISGGVSGSACVMQSTSANALYLYSQSTTALNVQNSTTSAYAATFLGGVSLTGNDAVAGTPATHGLLLTGGAASTSSGGTAGKGFSSAGGAGAASTNGAGDGGSFAGGGTTTVSGGSGLTLTHTGSGKDLNATTTPLTLAKTTNITGFNDIAATAIVSAGAITTSGGKVSEVALVDTLTTYTGDTPQTGDSYARLGVPAGASIAADLAEIEAETDGIAAIPTNPLLVSSAPANFGALLISAGGHISNVDTCTTNTDMRGTDNAALAATALSTAQWTNTLATNLGTLAGHDPGGTLASHTDVTGLQTHGDSTWATATGFALAANWTSTRAGYLDNLNVGGAVASHADVTALSVQIGSPQQVGTKYGVTLNATDVTGNLPANIEQVSGQSTVGGKDWYHALWYLCTVGAGQLPSGAGSGTEVWKDFGGTTAVTYAVDSNGNRTGTYA